MSTLSDDPPCVLDASDYCKRHRCRHVGNLKRLALATTETGAASRRRWDVQGCPGQRRSEPAPTQATARPCRWRGADVRDAEGRPVTRDCGHG